MSVLIKGMRMPKSCAACKFRWSDSESVDPFTDYCFLTNARLGYYANDRARWKKERRKNCPLIEVSDDAVSPCEVCPLVKMEEPKAEPEDTYCTEENCEIYQRDLSCDNCNR